MGYKMVERGFRTQVPGVLSMWFVSPCDGCPPLFFIDARVRGKKGIQVSATGPQDWEVFSYVDVGQGTLKWS
jgi:hypothetical protein